MLSKVVYPELHVPNPVAFLDRLELEVEQSTQWRLAKNHAECRAVVTEFIGSDFDGSGLAISAYVDDAFLDDPSPETITFAVIADRWGNDNDAVQLVSDAQINAAFGLFRPLVRHAAKVLRIPCRINYPKLNKPRPFPPNAAKRLDCFCRLANLSCLHPYDWGRFYGFVRFCHAHSVRLSAECLDVELRARHVPENLARMLSDRYEFGRSLLKGSDDWLD
jgi:hypothetical protein